MSGPDRQQRNLTRRSFLAASGATAAALTLPERTARARPCEQATAKNLIFMVADGMSNGALALGDLAHRRLRNKRSNWIELMQSERVARALIDTRSANSLVTDSAASSTAWSVGTLVNNGAIAVLPDGAHIAPILLRAKESGRATGLVTTTRVTHATPAGFAANTPRRSREDEIAHQYLDRGYDLILGGGAKHFTELDLSPLTLVRTRDELLALKPDQRTRLLGLFTDSHMSFDIERPEHEPSLEEMTRTAISILSHREHAGGGFVLQIEGGRVDHACHNNDAGALIHDQLAFDDALAAAANFALSRDDTLLIVTTDHATANPALTDYTDDAGAGFEHALGIRHSFPWIASQLADAPDRSAATLAGIIQRATQITITDAEADMLARWTAGDRTVDPFTLANSGYGPLASVIANHTAIAFLSPNHTSDLVELTALGPGADTVRPFMAIHEVHEVLRAALDLPPPRAM